MRKAVAGVCLFLCIAGCATVDVEKVPKGAAGDKVHGFRYHLPRPYVAVKKPMPIGGVDTIVKAQLNISGTQPSLQFEPKDLKDALSGLLAPEGSAQNVKVAPEVLKALEGALAAESAEEKEGEEGGKAAEGEGEGEGEAAASGNGQVSLGEFYDVIYLPDYEEQYAIQPVPGLGKLNMSIVFDHGWMLKSAGVETDNTAAVELLKSVVTEAAKLAAGIPGVPTGEGEGEGEEADAKELLMEMSALAGLQESTVAPPPVHVLVRVRLTREAMPGLYKLLRFGESVENSDQGGLDLNMMLRPSNFDAGIPPYRDTFDVSIIKLAP